MGVLTLQSLGLTAGSLGEDFNTPRGTCFHRGVDYRTGGAPMRFLAAVYGRVVAPIGGQWGTITVQPFGSPDIIQHLHCSQIDVSVGETVAPWTTLGKTGDVCPAGACNGVHLHLQVVSPTGSPQHECWDRNYTNPHNWNYINPALGSFGRKFSDTGSGNAYTKWDYTQHIIIASDLIGTPNRLVDDIELFIRTPRGQTCLMRILSRYNLHFEGHDGVRIRARTTAAGASMVQIGGSSDCSALRFTQAPSAEVFLTVQENSIYADIPHRSGELRKVSRLMLDWPDPDEVSRGEDDYDMPSFVLYPGGFEELGVRDIHGG